MKELIFLKELILISQINQKSVIFVIIGIFYTKVLIMNHIYGGHDLMQKAVNFNDVTIVSIKGSDYRIHFWYISKSHAINLLNNSVLDNKGLLYWIFL